MSDGRQAHWTAAIAALVALLTPAHAAAGPTYSHDDEVTTYATALAVAQVASQRCTDILAYHDGLVALRDSLHLVPGDDMALSIETRGLIRRFEDEAGKASSVTAWCDDVFRAFGPEGTAMRGLLAR